MRYADILDDGTSLTAAGWIGPGASDDEQFLSPFRSGADNWVADSRLLPIDRKAPTLGRVVVHGVWAGERVKVDRITPDLSEPRAVMESRALRRLAERSYPQAEGHPWPTADFDRWVTTSLVGHPDVLKVTHVSNGRSRVTVISTQDRSCSYIAGGTALPYGWQRRRSRISQKRRSLKLARASQVPGRSACTQWSSVTGRPTLL